MAISKIGKISIQIVLTLFYSLFIYGLTNDAIEAIEDPESRWAIRTGDETLKSYLLSGSLVIFYFVLGIILLFWKAKRRKLWIMLHVTPVIAFVIYTIIALCFFPELFDY